MLVLLTPITWLLLVVVWMLRNDSWFVRVLKTQAELLIEYFGEYRPIAENTTVEGLQSNRRVEIKILPNNTLRSTYPAGFQK